MIIFADNWDGDNNRGAITAPQDLLKRAALKIAATVLITTGLGGCATCNNVVIESAVSQDHEWMADLEYRVCGYVSGFSVSVYQTSSGSPGYGQGDLEPFQTSIRTKEPYKFKDKELPVSIKWTGERSLLIQHNTRMSIEDSSSKLKITKADSSYKDVSITYDPKPVLWE